MKLAGLSGTEQLSFVLSIIIAGVMVASYDVVQEMIPTSDDTPQLTIIIIKIFSGAVSVLVGLVFYMVIKHKNKKSST